MIEERQLAVRIEIDGGIDLENIASVVAAGAKLSWLARRFSARQIRKRRTRTREATVQWV